MDQYRGIWEEAIKLNSLLIPRFDGLTTFAIQSWCNFSKKQMSLLRRCLIVELGSPLFCTDYRIEQGIGLDFVVPKTGAYMYGNDKIEWSYKDVTKVLKLWIKIKLAGPLEFKCDHLDISTAIDHGKDHFKIQLLSLLDGKLRMKNGRKKSILAQLETPDAKKITLK